MIVPWKLLIKYFDDFDYADDLTVIDQSLNWAMLFFHEGTIYFGSNEKYEQDSNLDEPSERNFLEGGTTITKANYYSIGLLFGVTINFNKKS